MPTPTAKLLLDDVASELKFMKEELDLLFDERTLVNLENVKMYLDEAQLLLRKLDRELDSEFQDVE